MYSTFSVHSSLILRSSSCFAILKPNRHYFLRSQRTNESDLSLCPFNGIPLSESEIHWLRILNIDN